MKRWYARLVKGSRGAHLALRAHRLGLNVMAYVLPTSPGLGVSVYRSDVDDGGSGKLRYVVSLVVAEVQVEPFLFLSSRQIAARKAEREALLAEALQPPDRCRAGLDGECFHLGCPQLRDGEPAATGRHCPLDVDDPDA